MIKSQIFKSEFKINVNNIDFDIPVKDNMVNASLLCKTNKKKFYDYKILKITQKELENLSNRVSIPVEKLIYGSGKTYWIHIEMVEDLAKWISSSVGKQISEQLKNLYQKENIVDTKVENKHKENIVYTKVKNKDKENIIDTKIKIKDKEEDIFDKQEAEDKIIINNENNKVINYTLKLKDNTDFIIPIRKDGYVNATELCKAGGKRIDNYQTSKQGKEYLNELIKLTEFQGVKLLNTIEGKNGCTWVHRKVALHLAQWLSPSFSVQVSNWLDELLLTGKVELGKEKTNEELENIYEEKINKMKLSMNSLVNENAFLKSNYLSLEKTHDSLLKRRNYHKFKKGDCFYIVKDDWREKEYLKFGITSNINDRLQEYRTIVPECKILFLVYLENNELLENCVKSKYQNILTHQNHEYIINIEPEKLSKVIIQLIKFLNMQSTIDNTLDFYNNPYEKINNNKLEDNLHLEVDKNIDNNEITDLEEDNKIEIERKIETKKEDQEYKCELCDKVYKLEGNLKNHVIKVHDKKEINNSNTCHICDKILSDKGKLNRHIENVHKKVSKVKCDICKREYNSKDALNSHIKQVHNKSSVVKCDECDKIFTSRGNLTIHIKNVHEKILEEKCKICNKILTTKSNLVTHMKQVHEKINKIKCKICLKELSSKGGYEYHMSKIHKIIL